MKFWKNVFEKTPPIAGLTHPDYDANLAQWEKYRLTFEGGDKFIDQYLETFSSRENYVDYYKRRKISYCPAHAKSAILEIKNSIYQRMIDIIRKGGTQSYRQAIQGENLGVDLTGNTMDGYIGGEVLPDLLAIGKVGVYIDREEIENLKNQNIGNKPYLYKYSAEAIRSWRFIKNKLVSLLLEDTIELADPETDLIIGTSTEYRLLKLTSKGVEITIYDEKGVIIKKAMLKLGIIPFVIFEISQSLLTDVANYQIALLNLASSDMNYALKSNFPFYVEQYDAISELVNMRQARTNPQIIDPVDVTGNDGEKVQADQAKNKEISVGVAQGRRYPKGLEQPSFINPSPEPLIASMQKQDQLKADIRQLVHLSLQNVTSKAASAESKTIDERGLESGLSNIGLELEFGERKIAEIWQMYEGQKTTITVKYPTSYTLRTEDDRRKETKELKAELDAAPSKTYQKELAKVIATVSLGHKVSSETLEKIHKEIDSATIIVTTAEDVIKDHEAGLVSTETASLIRGYEKGEADKAKQDHAERAAAIVKAQQKAAGRLVNPASRGVDDLDDDTTSGKDEKKKSADDTLDADKGKKQRGEGK